MKRLVLVSLLGVMILESGCGHVSSPPPALPPPLAASAVGPPPEAQRGPWDPDRLKAAEVILQTPQRTELDRQRAALALAYIQWGETLFKGFDPAPSTITPAGERETPASNETSATPSSVSPLPPLWYWQEKQQHDLDRQLQQQRDLYYRERQPPPQSPRPPVCNSYQVGGQIYTQCR